MLTAEPPRTQYDIHFAIFGIPVRIHPLFWLMALLLGSESKNVPEVLTWVAAMFLAILGHELGHAAAMRAYGLSPWITLLGFGGLTSYDQGRSYQSRGADTLGQILIAVAGPAAGFVVVGAIAATFALTGHGDQLVLVGRGIPAPQVAGLHNAYASNLINNLLWICTIWGCINLLPIYPLDGGQILREILQRFAAREGIRRSLQVSIVAAVIMAIYGVMQWHSGFTLLMFGYLAYLNYAALRAYSFHDF
jgi:stage IV sporulation protein FB